MYGSPLNWYVPVLYGIRVLQSSCVILLIEFCRYYPLKKIVRTIAKLKKCHFNRPRKTRIRSVKGILALFFYILTFGLFQFIGVSTTHRIYLSMWILIYSFSDTYYVWAACGETSARLFINVWCGVGLAQALFPRFRCAWRPARFSFLRTGNPIFFL